MTVAHTARCSFGCLRGDLEVDGRMRCVGIDGIVGAGGTERGWRRSLVRGGFEPPSGLPIGGFRLAQ